MDDKKIGSEETRFGGPRRLGLRALHFHLAGRLIAGNVPLAASNHDQVVAAAASSLSLRHC